MTRVAQLSQETTQFNRQVARYGPATAGFGRDGAKWGDVVENVPETPLERPGWGPCVVARSLGHKRLASTCVGGCRASWSCC